MGLGFCEVERRCAFQIGLRHRDSPPFVAGNGLENIADVARVAGTEFRAAFAEAELS
jgi:hypothetical protein